MYIYCIYIDKDVHILYYVVCDNPLSYSFLVCVTVLGDLAVDILHHNCAPRTSFCTSSMTLFGDGALMDNLNSLTTFQV